MGHDRSLGSSFFGALADGCGEGRPVESCAAGADGGGDPSGALVSALRSVGGLERLTGDGADVAPDEIRADAGVAREVLEAAVGSPGNVATSLGGSLNAACSLAPRGSCERIDAYAAANVRMTSTGRAR